MTKKRVSILAEILLSCWLFWNIFIGLFWIFRPKWTGLHEIFLLCSPYSHRKGFFLWLRGSFRSQNDRWVSIYESLVHKLSAAVCAPHTATEKAFSCDSMVLLGSKIIVGIGYQFMSPWYTNLVPGAYAGPWSPAHSFVFWWSLTSSDS